MGVGIWSMHFIGMLAFSLPGIEIYYDVPLMVLSIVVAILASALALHLVSGTKPTLRMYGLGSFVMGAAIAGMHYIGIASMRLAAEIHWNEFLVVLSIIIAVVSSFAAILFAFKLREDLSVKGFIFRGIGGVIMGIAISGMHYTAMAAMSFTPDAGFVISNEDVLASDGLAAAVIIGTVFILGIALSGSNVDRALTRRNEGIRLRDEFMSIASHELKTPLTSAKLQNEMILRLLEKDEPDKNKLIKMQKNSRRSLDRITHLVDDMLDISRITTGKIVMRKTRCDLGDIVQEVVQNFLPQFEEQGTTITLTKCSAWGNFDAYRMEQVVGNLLSNALKYGEKRPVEVTLTCKENLAILKIKDRGIGIPQNFRSKLFNRFERAVSPMK